jgi:hypothetical protein
MKSQRIDHEPRQLNAINHVPAPECAFATGQARSIAVPSKRSIRSAVVLTALLTLCIIGTELANAQTDPTLDKHGNVTWTKKSSAKPPVKVVMGKDNVFYWTDGSNPDQNGNQKFEKDADYGSFTAPKLGEYNMYRPKSPDGETDKKVEDYHVEDSRGNTVGGMSFASADGGFKFQPLDNLAGTAYTVPWFASLGNGPTIYMAVDLGTYMSSNPNPFGSFTLGQTLSSFGVTITNGQISGINGLYFATAELVYDPTTGVAPIDGSAGWLNSVSYQSSYGPIGVIGSIGVAAPEPSSLLLLGSAVVGLSGLLRKRMQPRS